MVDREIVVVTGASAGVGRAVARRFGETGAAVALLARGRDGLKAAAKEVEAAGGVALAVPTDVADYEQVEAAAAEVEDRLGSIDIWVNNAMTTVFSKFVDITPEEYRRATDVTYHGVVFGTYAALRRMHARDRGTIVQVGSALAYRGIPLQSAYCGAKHAIVGFTDALRCELLHDRSSVHLTAVHLPALNTPQFGWCRSKLPRHPQPVKPIYQPEVAAEAIWWAAHHRRREVWVGGPTVGTILGNRLMPGLLDRYLGKTGVEGQQTDQPVDPNRPDNLFETVAGDHGVHGIFDQQAKDRSVQARAATQGRRPLVAGLVGVAAAAGLSRARRRR